MPTDILQVIMRAVNEVSGPVKQAADDIGGLGKAAGTTNPLIGALGSVAKVAGVAGIGVLASQATGATIDLGNLGQQVQRQRQYFTAYSGGTLEAAKNLEALKAAIGGAATEQEMMLASSKFLSMGLATNSEEVSKLAKMAVLLGGDTRTAGEAMEEFALLLANQSILRLDTFGISGAKVRQRIEELTAATAGLSREQAFMQAVMEVGTSKVKQLEDAGITAATSAQRLSVAWEELKTKIGEGLSGPVAGVQGWLANNIDSVSNAIDQLSNDKLTALKARLESVDNALADTDWAYYTMDTENAKAAIEALTQEAADLKRQIDYLTKQDTYVDWVDRIVRNSDRAAQAVDGVTQSMTYLKIAQSRGAFMGQRGLAYLEGRANAAAEEGSRWRQYGEWAGPRQAGPDVVAEWIQRNKAGNKSIADDWKRQMQASADQLSGYVSSSLSEAISSAQSLQPGGYTNPLSGKPGANGPFEGIFRAMDVLKLGGASPWAAQFAGMDQGALQQGVADFQKGIMSEAAKALIDVPALVDAVKMQQLAEKSREVFAQEIAKAAGVNPTLSQNIMDGMLGITTGKGGQAGKQSAGPVANSVTELAKQTADAMAGKEKDMAAAGAGWAKNVADGAWDAIPEAVYTIEQVASAMIGAMTARLNGQKYTPPTSNSSNGVKGAKNAKGV